jgi:hypothetical protein
MTINNLAVVWAPTLMDISYLAQGSADYSHMKVLADSQVTVVSLLIEHVNALF